MDVVATFVEAQPPGRLIDLEPGFAHGQVAQVLPMITDALVAVLRCPRDLAGAIARIALSHYVFPDPDATAVRREIRAAAGLPNTPLGRLSR